MKTNKHVESTPIFVDYYLKKQFQKKIINWYKSNHRDYPWRHTTNAFHIIIAEITLKLTGAWKAEGVYNKLIENYGTPEKMSMAKKTRLHKLFKSLGLYHRAELLINISNVIIDKFNSTIPTTYEELISIKGIGKYIANSVLCFAYSQKVPLVDGSVSRIFKRCLNYASERPAYADTELWELAGRFLPSANYREYNYGLLDLGALVCKHAKPHHEKCPLIKICQAKEKS